MYPSKHSLLKSKYLIPFILLLIFMTTAVSFGYKGYISNVRSYLGIASSSTIEEISNSVPVQSQTKPNNSSSIIKDGLPREVIYEQLFKHIAKISQQAAKLQSKGKDSKSLLSIFKRHAKLTDQQNDLLFKSASSFDTKAKALDKKYSADIAKVKELMKKSKIAAQPSPITFPDGFNKYKDERKVLVSESINNLKSGLGTTPSSNLEKFMSFFLIQSRAMLKERGRMLSKTSSTIPR
jgi:hypothetical protein